LKQLLQKLKNNWIRVWLIVIAIACFSFAGIAAYTEVSSVKRVVSTAATVGDPFSSNCMKRQIVSYRMAGSVFSVSVCNFDQNYPEKYCSEEITYIFTAKLQVKLNNQYIDMSTIQSELDALPANNRTPEEEAKYTLYSGLVAKAVNYSVRKTSDDKGEGLETNANVFSSSNNYTVTYGTDGTYEKLKGTKAVPSVSDIFDVTINSVDLDENGDPQFFVYVQAEGKSGVVETLSGRLYQTGDQSKAAAQWDGDITDSAYITRSYDFYNYVITGSGAGTLDIYWDSTMININKYFLIENNLANSISTVAANDPKFGDPPAEECDSRVGWNKASLAVDSKDINRYELQLYKTDSFTGDPSSYIKCDFNKTESQSEGQ